MKTWRTPPAGGVALLACILCSLLGVPGCAHPQIKARGIEVRPPHGPAAATAETAPVDAALLVNLVLASTKHMEVRWNPSQSDDPDLYDLSPRAGKEPAPGRIGTAIASARATLEAIPKKRWRKRSLRTLEALGLDGLEQSQGALLLDVLGARAVGDPETAAGLVERASIAEPSPLLTYEMGTAQMEAGNLDGAAATFDKLLGSGAALSPQMRDLALAAVAAMDGKASRAASTLSHVERVFPSLPESFELRAWISREACDLYRRDRIVSDIKTALDHQPCCAGCMMVLSELESFTGQPWAAAEVLSRPTSCSEAALDSVHDRALALSLAAAGQTQRALSVAADAESRDTSPLLAGLAPVFLLTGDHAHLVEAYDPESDLHLSKIESLQEHLYSGLNDFWIGKASAAAVQFERAEEFAKDLIPQGWIPRSTIQLLRSLRIRSFLVAGRLDEADVLAKEAQQAGAKAINGVLAYTASRVDLARGETEKAISEMRRLAASEEKFWLFLTQTNVFLRKGQLRRAQTSFRNALGGVNTQINFCPGIPVEPYVLETEARLLLAQGRAADAVRAVERLTSYGARGLFAPDLIIPSWELLGKAHEALGDKDSALAAYRKLVSLWGGGGEALPVLSRAEASIKRLTGAGS